MGEGVYLDMDNILSYLHVSVQFKYVCTRFFMRYMLTKLSNINLHKSSRDLSQLVYCKFYRKKKKVLKIAR